MDNFLQSTVIDSQDALDDALENPRFFDIVPLGKSAGIALSDGQVLNDKTVKSISSKIYSTSKVSKYLCTTPKRSCDLNFDLYPHNHTFNQYSIPHQLIVWRSFYFIASNFAGYDRSRVRLLLSDTGELKRDN